MAIDIDTTHTKRIIHSELSPAALVEHAVLHNEGQFAANGALVVQTGKRTGRSPQDRYIVREPSTSDAIDWGMVNRVLPPPELMPAALETARAIAANAPIGVRSAKAALDKATELDRATGYAFEIAVYGATVPTEDRLEGVRAFNEKRKPVFRGR